MRKRGLMLSSSNLCFFYINCILSSSNENDSFLTYLLKNQPNVFYQEYDCGRNVFHGATQFTIDFLIERTFNIPGVQMRIFEEILRNPNLSLEDDFFIYSRPNRACEMIELAETSGRPEIIRKCYFLPISLFYYDLDGETFFTKAILNRNLRRIKFLISRPDAIEFILTENLKTNLSDLEQDCIDLAIHVHDKNLDPNFTVMLNLFPVISSSFINGKIDKLEQLLDEFVDNIVEIDDNEILLTGLENALNSAKDLLNHDEYNEGKDVESENHSNYAFIDCLNQKLVEIYEFRLRKLGTDDSGTESSNQSDSDSDSTS